MSKFHVVRPGVLALALAAGLAMFGSSHAGGYAFDRTPHHASQPRFDPALRQIETRQMRQIDRIETAKRQGFLHPREYRALMREQDDIRASLRHALRDGRLDGREVRAITVAQDTARQNIRASIHDRHARYGHGPRVW